MLGLVGNTFYNGTVSGASYTQFVKLVKDRETLFDPDRAGLVFRGGRTDNDRDRFIPAFSVIGGVHQSAYGVNADIAETYMGKPLMFDPPLEFVSGEELLVYLNCAYDAAEDMLTTDIDFAAILNVKVE
ncbi:unnamed protein product [marine sediment metagenome]|uniref:Uncharacterized protein n=2 Tax=marine sediment metagenome TaxID=412755 RepID=X1J9V0_9ZZZZ